jgi:hypothetical protein
LGLDGKEVAGSAFDQNGNGSAADRAVLNEFVVALGGVDLGGVTFAAPGTIDERFLKVHGGAGVEGGKERGGN